MSNHHPSQEPNSILPPRFIFVTYIQCNPDFVQYGLDPCLSNSNQQQCFTSTTQTPQSWQQSSYCYHVSLCQAGSSWSTSCPPRSTSSPRTSPYTPVGPPKSPQTKLELLNKPTSNPFPAHLENENDHEARNFDFKASECETFAMIDMYVYCLYLIVIFNFNPILKVNFLHNTKQRGRMCTTTPQHQDHQQQPTTAPGNDSNIPKTTIPGHNSSHPKPQLSPNSQSEEPTPRHLDQPHNFARIPKFTTISDTLVIINHILPFLCYVSRINVFA